MDLQVTEGPFRMTTTNYFVLAMCLYHRGASDSVLRFPHWSAYSHSSSSHVSGPSPSTPLPLPSLGNLGCFLLVGQDSLF